MAVDGAGGERARGGGFPCEAHDMRRLLNVIGDQIADADRRHSQALVDMQDRLGVLGQVAQDLRGRLPDAMTPALDRIEDSMAALTSRLAEAEYRAVDAAIPGDGKVQSHYSTFDANEAGHGPAPLRSAMPADALGAYSRRDGLANVDRFDVVDSDFRSLGEEPWDDTSAEALTRIYEDDSARLAAVAGTDAAAGRSSHDIDQSIHDVASADSDVEAWHQPAAAAIATYLSKQDSERSGTPPRDGNFRELDERFAEIATRLERTLVGFDPSGPVNQIQARVQSLEESVVKAMTGAVTRADLSSLKSIENQVEDLTARFDTVQTHFSRLDTIELELRALAERISEDRLVKILSRTEPNPIEGERLAHAVSAEFAEHMPAIEQALKAIADRVSKENLAAMMETPAQRPPDIGQIARLVAEQVALSLPKPERQDNALEMRRIEELSALLQGYVAEKRQGDEQTSAMLDTMQQAMIRLLDRMDAIESMPAVGYDEGEPLQEETAEFDLDEERRGEYPAANRGQADKSGDMHRFDVEPQLPDSQLADHRATDRGGARPSAVEPTISIDPDEARYVPNQRFSSEGETDAVQAKQAAPANREDFIAAARRAARQAAMSPAEAVQDDGGQAGGGKQKRTIKPDKGEAKKRSLSMVTVALICVVIGGASFSIFKSTLLSSKPGVITPPVPTAAPATTKDKRLQESR